MFRQLHVFAVVDGAVDDDRPVLGEGLFQCRQQVFRLFDAVADGSDAFGEFDEVRIGEIDVGVMAELHVLLPLDEAVAAVVEDEGDEIRAQTVSRFKLLAVHHEAGVAGNRQDLLVGMDELGGNGAGDGDAHGGEAVGNNARIGLIAVVVAGDPDLVGADVGNDDVVFAHDPAAVDEGLLRLDRERLIGGVAFVFFHHAAAYIQGVRRFLQAGGLFQDAAQRVRNIADDFYGRFVVFVNIGRHGIDVNDVGLAQMPLGRGVFDDVIADGDDQAGPFQHLGLVVFHRNAYGPQRIGVVKGNDALGHHRIDDRDFQRFGKFRQHVRGVVADGAAAGQDDRIFGVGNHGRRRFDLRLQGRFRQDSLALHRPFRIGDGHVADVYGQVDEGRPRLFPFGVFEGQAGDFRHRIGTDDGVGSAGNGLKHRAQI